ncbi:glycoside hydrolase family 97 protein [Aeoliella sp. ICT_H6.2]|uniref:Glycoside hydrolase family 97 protein n=1 Tax=Aeoliella straminimaris TaxID=2954799 RepID=A0A9X2JKV3_9BACT|nr:glycoside hydrolase family 97 protein [Aeoliella straminimaris]MCO6047474.1 glycoside hydrolase family 97 protein [Aeoliella straminimaris]
MSVQSPIRFSTAHRVLAFLLLSCPACFAGAEQSWDVDSPSGRLAVHVEVADGVQYSVSLGDTDVVLPSRIDMKVGAAGWLSKAGPVTAREALRQETIEFPVPRKYRTLEMTYRELVLRFGETAKLTFRVYDEGVAYRWSTALEGEVKVWDEVAEFEFPATTKSWFPEEDDIFSHQERVYLDIPLSSVTPERFCSTGVLMSLENGPKVYLSESDLRSYPGMFLRGLGQDRVGLAGKFVGYPLKTELRGDRNIPVTNHAKYLAKSDGSRTYPWRVILVASEDKELIMSEMIYALAPRCELDSTDWIEPGKVSWDWWNGIDIHGVDFPVGVNTETYKHFIDFAAEYGLEYILLDEGWSASSTNVLESRPEIDIEEIVAYANEKGVRVLLWSLWNPIDADMENILDQFEKWGVAGVKVDFMQRDDQAMVDFYWRCAREAAKRELLVDFHGAFKPMGLRRAYPNVMTNEGLNGLEQYKWTDEKATPEHELVLPFIRMVAGPMDYTPGAMRNATKKDWRAIGNHPMSLGTRCHQLAMYVIYESPLQMLADSPTNYRDEPECMKLLSAVPTVWDELVVLDAKVSDYVLLARRSGDEWYLGAMTDWEGREMMCPLSFLPEGEYELQLWRDGVNADRNAEDFCYEQKLVTSSDVLQIKMASGGGWVGRLRPAN